jgi:hypothetical protein
VRENRTHGSEGGDGESRFRPLSELISRTEADLGPPPFVFSKEKLGRVASGFLTSQYAFGWLTVWPLALLRRNILIA